MASSRVALLPSESPNGIAIIQMTEADDGAVWLNPWATCCMTVPVWKPIVFWGCKTCHKKLDPQPSSDLDLENIMWVTQKGIRVRSIVEIKSWISKWTGLELSEFELGLDYS